MKKQQNQDIGHTQSHTGRCIGILLFKARLTFLSSSRGTVRNQANIKIKVACTTKTGNQGLFYVPTYFCSEANIAPLHTSSRDHTALMNMIFEQCRMLLRFWVMCVDTRPCTAQIKSMAPVDLVSFHLFSQIILTVIYTEGHQPQLRVISLHATSWQLAYSSLKILYTCLTHIWR